MLNFRNLVIKVNFLVPLIAIVGLTYLFTVGFTQNSVNEHPIKDYKKWAELEKNEFASDKSQKEIDRKTYYVDQKIGKDQNPGITELLPFKTIQQANKRVSTGDIVYVKNGTYKENITVTALGEPQNWITFKAFPGHKPNVIGTQDGTFKIEGNYIVIDGFKITSIELGSGIHVGKGNHHTKIINNEINNAGCGGISGQETDYLYIEGNISYKNAFRSPYQCSGISIYQAMSFDDKLGFHNIIRGNISYGNENKVAVYKGNVTDGNGIIIDDLRHTQGNKGLPRYTAWTLVENNIVFDNGGRGIHVYQSDNVVVRNNTTFNNVRSKNLDGHLKGELTTYFSSNIMFYNNIAYARDKFQKTFVDDYSKYNEWDYNLSYNGSILLNDGHSDVVLGKNNLVNVDPQFINPSTVPEKANFHLKPNSPAINTGTNISAAKTDFDGVIRPVDVKYDKGAYEFHNRTKK